MDGGGGKGENSPYVCKHRSLTPLGPLPYSPLNFNQNLLRQGTSTADHLTFLRLLLFPFEIEHGVAHSIGELAQLIRSQNSLSSFFCRDTLQRNMVFHFLMGKLRLSIDLWAPQTVILRCRPGISIVRFNYFRTFISL